MKTPFISREDLETIVAEFPTPFHLYDEKGFVKKQEPSTRPFLGIRIQRIFCSQGHSNPSHLENPPRGRLWCGLF